MSSDEDGVQLMAAFKRKSAPAPKAQPAVLSPAAFISDDGSDVEPNPRTEIQRKPRRALEVRLSPVRNREQYTLYEPEDEIDSILREYNKRGTMMYGVKLWSGATKQVSETLAITQRGNPEVKVPLAPATYI